MLVNGLVIYSIQSALGELYYETLSLASQSGVEGGWKFSFVQFSVQNEQSIPHSQSTTHCCSQLSIQSKSISAIQGVGRTITMVVAEETSSIPYSAEKAKEVPK